MRRSTPSILLLAAAALGLAATGTDAQVQHATGRPLAPSVLVPQARAFGRSPAGVQVAAVRAGVSIVEQVATTTLDIDLANPGGRRAEAELIVPVPGGAVLRGFDFHGSAAEPSAELLPREEARRIYESIVRRERDPALLEFVGLNLIRSSVFPIEAGGTQKVRLTYEQVLAADGDRVDYVLPRSESLELETPWAIAARIRSKRPISTAYSPSHEIAVERRGDGEVEVKLEGRAAAQPGPFRLSWLHGGDGVSASLLAYPDAQGGGAFLLLAGLPPRAEPASGGTAIRRELTLVIDRSGSMGGEKIEQARAAALQVIAGLDDGEAFNIIAFNDRIESFASAPVLKTADSLREASGYIRRIAPRSGTNIHDALVEALGQEPVEGMLPIVLFLTDGLPTVGQTSEAEIRGAVQERNPHRRRVFTFGIGADVNTPLLESVAADTRAAATFVLPREDVEVKVGGVFRRLAGPILADPRLEAVDAERNPIRGRIAEVFPDRLPDLFEGDQLVVLGRYSGSEPIRFRLGGNYLGAERAFRFEFPLDGASVRNAFVPRLWASRKIAMLEDAIRRLGAGAAPAAALASSSAAAPAPAADPRLRELVDEIVRLSTEYGILTEYTAFLAREGTDLARREDILAEAVGNYQRRAWQCRSGIASVNQEVNRQAQKRQQSLNLGNTYWDEKMNRVQISTVQQVNDLAFYRRQGRWVDSRLAVSAAAPARTVEFGSEEFRELLSRLAGAGRQGCIALSGEILILLDGKPVLVRGPAVP